jgi:hypothetical protein
VRSELHAFADDGASGLVKRRARGATNNTSGMRRAAAASIRLICACATGERSTKACVIRGRITSSA